MKGVFAGMLISIGGCAYLSCENEYIGAFLFTIALFFICLFGLPLYTGEVGFYNPDASRKGQLVYFLNIFCDNLIGVGIGAILIILSNPNIMPVAYDIAQAKLLEHWASVFAGSILCGVLMFLAVFGYRLSGKYIPIFLCVPAFILCGFEHSVANLFYFVCSGELPFKMLLYTVLMVIGNGIGAIFVGRLFLHKKKG